MFHWNEFPTDTIVQTHSHSIRGFALPTIIVTGLEKNKPGRAFFLGVTASRSVNEHAQCQSSGTSSPNNLMGFMVDILSWAGKVQVKITLMMLHFRWACSRALVMSCSLTDLLAVTLNGMKPLLVTPVLVLQMSAVKSVVEECACVEVDLSPVLSAVEKGLPTGDL